VPVLLGTRILEVLLIGMYPLASISLYKFEKNNSRRTKIILYLLILAVVLTSIYRYYSQIQRRVILG
jgi:cytochrome bd-type quinol oxidase subunit 1